MSADLALSAAKILGSVALLALVLRVVGGLGRRARLDPEVARKLIHVGLGLYCLTFPWIFRDTWEVAATCALAAGVFVLARGRYRRQLGQGLHGVQRMSYGELLFAASVVLLFELKSPHFISAVTSRPAAPELALYILPLLILTLCDAAAAVVGSAYGRKRFHVADGAKSWEGVVVFVVLAWLFSLIALLLLSETPRGEAIVLALITALFGALLEAASWRGLDNLFIPLGLYFILSNLMMVTLAELLIVSSLFALALVAVFTLGRRIGVSRHWLATAATLLFCIAIFSGPESVATPAVALGAYALCARTSAMARPAQDPLNLVLTSLGLALAFYLVSHFARVDTIFGFNLAFACLAVAIGASFRPPLWALILVGVVAYAALSLRTLLLEGFSAAAIQFQWVAIAAMLAVAVLGRLAQAALARRPWIATGALSFAAGLFALRVDPS